MSAMNPVDMIGLDLHKRESQLCILAEDGEVVERRISTTKERFTAVLGNRSPARILLEASTESEWVARCLEDLGHEVIVADPNFAPMYATRSRRVKTDKRDARTLAEAAKLGAYRPAHRASDAQRHVRAELAVREALVRTRTRYIALLKALVRRDGLRIASGPSHRILIRLAAVEISDTLASEIAPLVALLRPLNAEIASADARIAAITECDPVVQRLMTVPGVGPVTATAFVATLDDVKRFAGAHQVEAYLGLVPRETSSGEKQHRGAITKAGNARVRWLLVEAAWGVLRSTRTDAAVLQAWALRVAARRGKRVAVVALARRLAGILYAMWRNGTAYGAVHGEVYGAVRHATADATARVITTNPTDQDLDQERAAA